MLVLLQPVQTVYDAANTQAAHKIALGISDQINALSPGMTIAINVPKLPGVAVQVKLEGQNVSVTVNGATTTSQVTFTLPSTTLSPGKYTMTMKGEITVA